MAQSFQLGSDALARLFPFHVVCDWSGSIQTLSPAIMRLVPSAQQGDSIHRLLEIVRPRPMRADPRALVQFQDRACVVRFCGHELTLKGQTQVVNDGAALLLVCNVLVSNQDQVRRWGLSIADFSLGDAVPDCLLHLQTSQSALLDAQRLSESLRTRTAQLEHARAQAEAASSAKSSFLAMMSHEIRTPMNGIGSMIDLLLESALEAPQRDHLLIAQSSTETLRVLLDDVLDFAKIEAGRMEFACEVFDPGAVLREAVRLYEPSAEQKGLGLAVWIDPRVPLAVRGDPVRLRQVVTNLIGNAIKFTAQGEVVALLQASEADGKVRLQATIKDTGCGVAPHAVERLFQPFSQADAGVHRQFGGTGLGLAISRQLARGQHGDLALADSTAAGSVFVATFTLPVVDEPKRRRRPLRIGLDPTQVAYDALVDACQAIGLEVASGASPDMDAMLVCRNDVAAGSDASTQGNVPRIAVLAHGRTSAEQRDTRTWASGLGASTLAELDSLQQRLDADSQAAPAVAATEQLPGGSVLVVDDHELNRRVAQRLLEKLGMRVVLASDGVQGLAAAQTGQFDLVLLDLQMPGMDGFSVARQLRQHATGSTLPIIACSADAQRETQLAATQAGVDDFLAKPYRLHELRAILQRWLRPAPAPASTLLNCR